MNDNTASPLLVDILGVYVVEWILTSFFLMGSSSTISTHYTADEDELNSFMHNSQQEKKKRDSRGKKAPN